MTVLNATSRSVLERTLQVLTDQRADVVDGLARAQAQVEGYTSGLSQLDREIADLSATITASIEAEFTMQYDAEHLFPFVEDENANITGYGHQDPAEFAAAVNVYDALARIGEPIPGDPIRPRDIDHRWAKLNESDDFVIDDVTEDTPGAFPITTVWHVR